MSFSSMCFVISGGGSPQRLPIQYSYYFASFPFLFRPVPSTIQIISVWMCFYVSRLPLIRPASFQTFHAFLPYYLCKKLQLLRSDFKGPFSFHSLKNLFVAYKLCPWKPQYSYVEPYLEYSLHQSGECPAFFNITKNPPQGLGPLDVWSYREKK